MTRWKIVEAGSTERRELHRLEAELFDPDSPSRGAWLLDANPAGKGICLVAISPEGRLAGTRSLLPWSLLVDGERVKVGQYARSWTHPDFRRQGVSVAIGEELNRRSAELGHPLLFLFPSDRSAPGHRRIGNLLDTLLERRQALLSVRFFTSRFPRLLDPTVRGIGLAMRTAAGVRGGKWVLLGHPRGEADRLWERSRPGKGVWGVRDGEFVAWRYAERSGRPYQVWGFPAGEPIRAMAATHTERGRGRILDVWGDLASDDLAAAVAGLVDELEKGGALLVEWCPPRFGSAPAAASRAGLLRRRRGVRFARWLHRPPQALGPLADLGTYRLTEGDSDYA